MLLDRDLRYVAANPAYETALGRSEGELIGRYVLDAFPNAGETAERVVSSLRRVFETREADTLAFLPYEIERPADQGGELEERYWTAVHTPLLDDEGEVIFVLQNTVDITEIAKLREAASVPFRILPGELELVQRAQEAEAAHRSLQDSSLGFRRLFQDAPGMVAVLQGPRHVFTFVNNSYERFVGRSVIGLAAREALPELEDQPFFDFLDEVFTTGRATIQEAHSILLRRQGSGELEEAYLDFSYHPIREENGTITGVFVQAYERTEAILLQQRQRLLLDELNHRVKNTLSTVQSIARQSFKTALDPVRAQKSFDARIQALSKAHDVLAHRQWESAELKAILKQELAVYEAKRVVVDGPLTRLKPKAAIAFAMVFHELSSNAAKYGALAAQGAVEVSWRRMGGELRVEWRERGFDTQDRTLAPGFGMKMLHRIITGELDGALDLAFFEHGLICRITVPLAEVEAVASIETS